MARFDGERLRQLRESRMWDQTTFAGNVRAVAKARGIASGVSQTMVSRYESGGQTPSFRNIEAMAATLGIEPSDLLIDEARREEQEASDQDAEGRPLTYDEYALYGQLTARIVAAKAEARERSAA